MKKKALFIKTFFLILIGLFSLVISIYINKNSIEISNRNSITLTPENFSQFKNNIKPNDIVQINGTLNYLNILTNNDQIYYAGLKEYSNKIIIKLSVDKFIFNPQTFIGKVMLVSDVQSYNTLITKMNSPLDLSDQINNTLVKELGKTDAELISSASVSNFNKDTLILMDNNYLNKKQLFTNLLAFFLIIFISLILITRNFIF